MRTPHESAGTGRAQLSGAFRTPTWLRDLGRSSWLLVGVLALVVGLIWLVAETYTIVGPMVCALIVAVVAMPVVRVLDRHMPRALAAALVLLAVAAICILVVVIVVAGITGQQAGALGAGHRRRRSAAELADERRRRLLERRWNRFRPSRRRRRT